MTHQKAPDPDDLDQQLQEAIDLLTQCLNGFSSFIHGRKMAKKERDALRARVDRFLGKQPSPTKTDPEAPTP